MINDFPGEWREVCEVLTKFRLLKSSFAVKGENLSPISAALDLAFKKLGWKKRTFDTEIHVDDRVEKSQTHEVDCFKGKVGLEVEWNNKDPFFGRDLIFAGSIKTNTSDCNPSRGGHGNVLKDYENSRC